MKCTVIYPPVVAVQQILVIIKISHSHITRTLNILLHVQ